MKQIAYDLHTIKSSARDAYTAQTMRTLNLRGTGKTYSVKQSTMDSQ